MSRSLLARTLSDPLRACALLLLIVGRSGWAGGDPEAPDMAAPPLAPSAEPLAAPTEPAAGVPDSTRAPAPGPGVSDPPSEVAAPQKDAPERVGATPPPLPPDALVVGGFSSGGGQLPEGWEPLLFEKIPTHTTYAVVQEEGRYVVRAQADASASGLIRKVDLDLRERPILRWRWKVSRVLDRGNVAEKAGDDYAARIYIAFKYEPKRVGFLKRAQYLAGRALFGDIPIGALNYIWASRATIDEVYDNSYAGSFVKMIPVETGVERVGEWIQEQRNVYEDYRRAFGEDPPRVEGVAIMTDTDNTGESALSWYGDLVFVAD